MVVADDPRILELTAPGGELVARFATGAGMVGCSLRHRGEELLGLRSGLDAYIRRGSTFGIPLLYPWANRLGGWSYAVAGRAVTLDRGSPLLRADEHGLPIHGALAARPDWQVTPAGPSGLRAALDFAEHPDLLAVFPFPHRLELAVELAAGGLTVTTTVAAAAGAPVPLSFGFHPYLAPPGAAREDWLVELPARTALGLDERGLPTGDARERAAEEFPLRDRTFDDLFALPGPVRFSVAAAGRRLAVEMVSGYPYAQVFAPAGQALICFEPMTAPVDALRSHDGLRIVPAGVTAQATFALAVEENPECPRRHPIRMTYARSGSGRLARMAEGNGAGPADRDGAGEAPERAGLVLLALILVAGVANLNLSVANVALPEIGKHFDSSQTTLDLIAVGYSLGLAATVLYLGALGDRYGRKMMLLSGLVLSVPACLLAAFAPSDGVLFGARVLGGISAGMAYPTTLALITALWAGPGRTRSIALWSALGGAIASLGPLIAGALLEQFDWGSVFLVTLPLVVVAFPMAWRLVPAHVNEATEPVDNFGGILSLVLVATLILAINFAPVPNKGTLTLALAGIAIVALIAFFLRQRRAANPLYDLHVAARRTFWVAACAGIIVFGSLMGAAFVSQQFLQNVLGYSTLGAGAAFLPAIVFMVLVAPRSAKLVDSRGARFTLLCGYVFLVAAFLWMLLLWDEGAPYWRVAIAYVFIGIGVGFAGTPASHSLTGSVPVRRAGMASGTADLQRDLGGAIMQSVFGALLTAGYATAAAAAIAAAPNNAQVNASVQGQLTKSFSGAEAVAERYPQYASQITTAAKQSFLDGDQWAYTAGLVAVLLGAALVYACFPKKSREAELLAAYHAEDVQAAEAREPQAPPVLH